MIEEIRKRITAAMREKDDLTRNILKVALGDLQAAESRQSTPLTPDQAAGVVRKIIKGNEETIGLTKDAATIERLRKENAILESLLPQSLSVEEIVAALAPVEAQVRGAGNDGQATGVAMKHLKSTGATVTGADVATAVKRLRG